MTETTEPQRDADEKLKRAEAFVRDELRLMGQLEVAENAALVRRVALRIAENM